MKVEKFAKYIHRHCNIMYSSWAFWESAAIIAFSWSR